MGVVGWYGDTIQVYSEKYFNYFRFWWGVPIDIVPSIGYNYNKTRIYKDGKNMDEAIILLAGIVYGKGYADLLKEDLSDYSDKDKREALSSLKEQAQEKSLSKSQRRWLTSNTTY